VLACDERGDRLTSAEFASLLTSDSFLYRTAPAPKAEASLTTSNQPLPTPP